MDKRQLILTWLSKKHASPSTPVEREVYNKVYNIARKVSLDKAQQYVDQEIERIDLLKYPSRSDKTKLNTLKEIQDLFK